MSFWCRCLHLRKDLLGLKVSVPNYLHIPKDMFVEGAITANSCNIPHVIIYIERLREQGPLSGQYLSLLPGVLISWQMNCTVRATSKKAVVTTCSACSSQYKCDKYILSYLIQQKWAKQYSSTAFKLLNSQLDRFCVLPHLRNRNCTNSVFIEF